MQRSSSKGALAKKLKQRSSSKGAQEKELKRALKRASIKRAAFILRGRSRSHAL